MDKTQIGVEIMDNDLHLDNAYDTPLTSKERNALIRYCIATGTRARCATTRLLRPFRQKYLVAALREFKASHFERIAKIEEQIRLYNEGELQLSDWEREFFCGTPSKKQYEKYMRELIKQERDIVKSISKSYTICVDFSFISKELLEFHNSLNPRTTFGYSTLLHEECNFELTDENMRAFLNSSLKDLPQWERDWSHDWGYVFFDSITSLCYEDLIIFRGDRCILETISHEEMMTIRLTDDEIDNLTCFEDDGKNSVLIEKLKEIKKQQRKQ